MNWKKGLTGLLATSSLLLAACGNGGGASGEAANEDGELTLGTVFAITGAFSSYGTPQENAINMAIDEINADGGVLDGQDIGLVNYDYTSVDTEAAQLTTRLATQDNVDAILGADTSGSSKAPYKVLHNMKRQFYLHQHPQTIIQKQMMVMLKNGAGALRSQIVTKEEL